MPSHAAGVEVFTDGSFTAVDGERMSKGLRGAEDGRPTGVDGRPTGVGDVALGISSDGLEKLRTLL